MNEPIFYLFMALLGSIAGILSDVQIDHEDLDGGFKVIVRLKEKPIVDEITFSKIRYYNKKFLQSKMKTKKDKFLDNKTLKDDVNMIIDLYKKKGLTQAKVDVETFIDETTNKATLSYSKVALSLFLRVRAHSRPAK